MNISPDIINVSEALERVDGDSELLGELVEIFLEESPSMLAEIQEAVSQKDAKALEHSAHTLKGAVGNFGAQNVVEAAFVLEKAGREGNLAGTETRLNTLEQSLQELEPALSALRMEMAA